MNIDIEEIIDENITAIIDNQVLSLPIYKIKKHDLNFSSVSNLNAIIGEPVSFVTNITIEQQETDEIITQEDNQQLIGHSVVGVLRNTINIENIDSSLEEETTTGGSISDSSLEEDIIKNFIIDENNNLNVVFDEKLKKGAYTIILTFNETKYFNTSSMELSFEIDKNNIDIQNLELCTLEEIETNTSGTLITDDANLSIPFFETRYLRFKLINSQNNNPIPNVSMTTIIQNEIEETSNIGISDENGEVILQISLPKPHIIENGNICKEVPTTYNIQIKFNSDEDFLQKYIIEEENEPIIPIQVELTPTNIGIKKIIQQKNKTKNTSLLQISGDIINYNTFDPVICGEVKASQTFGGETISKCNVNEIGFYQLNDIPLIVNEANQEESFDIPKQCSKEKNTLILFNSIPDIEVGKHFKLSARVMDEETQEPIMYGMVVFYISNSEETLEQYPRFMVELNKEGYAETTVNNLEALIETTTDKNYFMAKYLGVFEYKDSSVKIEK